MTSNDHLPSRARLHGPAAVVFTALAVCVGGSVGPLEAQDPPSERLKQMHCERAEQIRAQADAWTSRREAIERGELREMRGCPELGAGLLARLWLVMPADRANGTGVLNTTMAVRDERIFATMLDLISDRQQPRKVRLGALTVAVNYADTSLVMLYSSDEMLGPFPGRNFRVTSFAEGRSDLGPEGSRRPGPRPVAGDPMERLTPVLELIENRADEDPYVRGAVRALFGWQPRFWRQPYHPQGRPGG